MDATLLKHLWRSPDVRRALKKEAWRLLAFVVICVGTAAISRYIQEKPILKGVLSATIGAGAVILMWLVSAVRTLLSVLRETDPLR